MIRKINLGMALLLLTGLILAACATSPAGEVTDASSGQGGIEKRIFVGPLLVDCTGEAPQKCMLVKENPEDEYTLFYDQIEGFKFEEGFEYELIVREDQVENAPADASSLKWTLVEILNKQSVPVADTGIEKTIFIGPELVDCTGVGPQKCMLVKENPEDEYSLFYDQIEGFKFEEGYEYELVVREEEVKDPPADASSLRWTLVEMVSKEPVSDTDGVQLENSEWVMVSYTNQDGEIVEALPGVNSTAFFQNGQVIGNAGCNGYSGGYEVDGDQLSVGPLASTEMFCGGPPGVMDQEVSFLAALNSAASYIIEQEQLMIKNEDSETVLIFEIAEPKSLTGKLWNVIAYNNGQEAVVSVIIGSQITAFFDEDGTLSGSAGCNNYSAPYSMEGDQLTIGPAITTRMMCSDPDGVMDQEMQYLAALDMVSAFNFEGERLILLDSEGRRVVDYQPAKTFALTETIWHLDTLSIGDDAVSSIIQGTDLTAIFSEDGIVSGSAGCNNYSGKYEIEGQAIAIELGPLTMMFCEEPEGTMDQETAYLEALESATAFEIRGDMLSLKNDDGQEVLRYRASDLVGYVWMWLEFLGNDDTQKAPDNPSDYTLELKPDGTVAVKADCNNASGTYSLDGSQVDIEIMSTTLAACPEGSLGDEFTRLLNDAVIYFRDGDFMFLDIMMDAGTMRFIQ